MTRYIFCADCRHLFVFTEEEQELFQKRHWSEPKRCKSCRKQNREKRKDPYYGAAATMNRGVGPRRRHTRVHYPPHVVGGFR